MALKKINIDRKITDRSNESFNLYLKELAKLPVATEEENIELCIKAQEGDIIARNKLIERNLRFVITCAKHFQGQGLELCDLVSEGNLGLFRAIDSFDHTKGVKFLSYAVNWIEQTILEALSHTTRTIRIPVSHLNACRKAARIADQIETNTGQVASTHDVAEAMGIPEKKVRKLFTTPTKCASLDTPIESKSDDITCLLDLIPSNLEGTDSYVLNKELHNKLMESLHELTIRSRCIIQMFYGINVTSKTLEEIGKYFGLTSERIRQLKDEAIIDLERILKQKGINY
jgi:RNA polymerase primary sigma factor